MLLQSFARRKCKSPLFCPEVHISASGLARSLCSQPRGLDGFAPAHVPNVLSRNLLSLLPLTIIVVVVGALFFVDDVVSYCPPSPSRSPYFTSMFLLLLLL